MEKKIRIGICGYGNLGHGVELAVNRAEDMELVGVFSRRDLPGTASGVPAINLKHVLEYKDKIDVMILCGGSATDLIDQGPELAQHFVRACSPCCGYWATACCRKENPTPSGARA